MNTRGIKTVYTVQRETCKELETNTKYCSNATLNNPDNSNLKPKQFQLKTASKKINQIGKGFYRRQFSSSHLQNISKPDTQSTKVMFNKKEYSRDKSIELLEQRYIQALNQVKQIKTERAIQKYARMIPRNNYVSKSPINSHIKLNTELLKKKTQQFIEKRTTSNKLPIRPRTPDYIQKNSNKTYKTHRQDLKTPDGHYKRMSYYMNTNNNFPTKSPSRNIKKKSNTANMYQTTKTNYQRKITQNVNDVFYHYQYMSTRAKVNNTMNKTTMNHNTVDTIKRTAIRDQKCSFINSTINNSSSQRTLDIKQKKSFSIYPETKIIEDNDTCIVSKPNENFHNQFVYKKIINKTNKKQMKKDPIRLSKAKEVKDSQSKKTIQSTFIFPDEKQIDFNELDQFSPPYVGSINFNINKEDKLTSRAGSTNYTTIEMVNQEKQLNGTIATLSLPSSNNIQIIDNFLNKLNSNTQKYSTVEYNHITTFNDFDRGKSEMKKEDMY